MITFDKKYLGTDRYLSINNNGIQWINQYEGILFGSGKHWDWYNFLELYCNEIPQLIPSKYKKMCEEMKVDFSSKMLDKRVYLSCVKKHVRFLTEHLQQASEQPYCDIWMTSRKILDQLQPAPINHSIINKIQISLEDSARKKFETLKSNISKNYIRPPVYKQNSTKTGRLTVSSGPNILTMPSEWKSIIKNARQIDFVSMEPMLLMALSGKKIPTDVYSWIKDELNLKESRSRVKILTIISMYGGKDNKTTRRIDELLGIPERLKMIEAERKDGFIFNSFGRPINVSDEIKGRHLFALWLQSSAVDASLMGFSNFLKDNPKINPHWIIHDGLLFTGECNNTSSIFINDQISLPVTIEDLENVDN